MPLVKVLRSTIKHGSGEYKTGQQFECTDEELRVLKSVRTPIVIEVEAPKEKIAIKKAVEVIEEGSEEEVSEEETEDTEEEVSEEKPVKKVRGRRG